MANLILNGSTSGSVTLSSPAVSGTTTLTLPTTSGTVLTTASTFGGTGPAFSAYKSGSSQSISSGVFTKITYDVEEFDTNNNFASSRFTPTVAGYYQINANTYLQASSGLTRALTTIYKNGSSYKFGNDNLAVSGTEGRGLASALVYLNGSTDYVEIYILPSATSPVIQTSIDNTWFQGSLVRSA
jgi:hypothetical protein